MIPNYRLPLQLWKQRSWTFQEHIDLQSQANYVDEYNLERMSSYYRQHASGYESGDMEQEVFQIW